MARYIDADNIKLKGIAFLDENLDFLVSLSDVRKSLQMTPTADVAPRAEVAREIFEEMKKEIKSALESNYKAENQWVQSPTQSRWDDEFLGVIRGKINTLRGIGDFIDELEKKYMEE